MFKGIQLICSFKVNLQRPLLVLFSLWAGFITQIQYLDAQVGTWMYKLGIKGQLKTQALHSQPSDFGCLMAELLAWVMRCSESGVLLFHRQPCEVAAVMFTGQRSEMWQLSCALEMEMQFWLYKATSQQNQDQFLHIFCLSSKIPQQP